MAELRGQNLLEHEKTIEKLKNENESLKKEKFKLETTIKSLKGKVSELERENTLLKGKVKKLETPEYLPEIEKVSKPTQVGKIEIPLEFEPLAPRLSEAEKPIITGSSRRECPVCGNTRHMVIHELIDKTNVISYYPRVYGKKYKCGECGSLWKVPALD